MISGSGGSGVLVGREVGVGVGVDVGVAVGGGVKVGVGLSVAGPVGLGVSVGAWTVSVTTAPVAGVSVTTDRSSSSPISRVPRQPVISKDTISTKREKRSICPTPQS
jgi:hypothetical protein